MAILMKKELIMSNSQQYLRTKVSFLLGFAFLLQAVTSLISGAVFFDPLVVDGNIQATLLNVADNEVMVHASIFGDLITSLGIILLAVMLYSILKNVKVLPVRIALCFYIFEATLLTVSKFFTYALLESSLMYKINPGESLLELGEILLKAKDFSYSLHIIPFGIGAILFYYVLYKSDVLPKWLSLWGLVTVPIILVGVTLMMYGVPVPFVILLPYVPFEFVTGIYIMVRGLKVRTELG